MKSNKEFIKSLENSGVLKSLNIKRAFLQVDRIDFVLDEYKDLAYFDTALPIGHGQTISQPYTVAFMLELLEVKKDQKVLDIGSGSGWSTALLANIVGKKGFVKALELIDKLVDMGRENIKKYAFQNIEILKAKESEIGVVNEKFDRILVSASAEKFPEELLNQVKKGGIIVIPIKNSIFKFIKHSDKDIEKEEYFGFSFVELK